MTGRSRSATKPRRWNRPKPKRKYVLYEGWEGEPRSHWRDRRKATVPGCVGSQRDGIYPPPFRWVVRARSAPQACSFVYQEVRATDREDGLGILWDRKHDYPEPPPLGKDLTQHWAVVAWCNTVTITLWYDREDAETVKAELDRGGCGGCCHRAHEIVPMTIDEVKKQQPAWSDGPKVMQVLFCGDPGSTDQTL